MRLRPYQQAGARFLAARRFALCADDMGLGKTAQAVRACDYVNARDVLVLCPGAVRPGWRAGFTRWSPLDRPLHVLYPGESIVEPLRGVVIASYELAAKRAKKALMRNHWDALILDEAHQLKSPAAKRTQAVFGRRVDAATGLAARARQVWALSGTPMPNHPGELWVLLHAAGVYAKPHERFLQTFCAGFDGPYGFKVTGARNAAALRRLLADTMIRRSKQDVLPELPALSIETLDVEPAEVPLAYFSARGWAMDPAKAMRDLEADADVVRGVLRAAPATARAQALEAVATGVSDLRRYIGLSKVPGVADFIARRLDAVDAKIVVFAYHRDVIQWLVERLKAYAPVTYWGGQAARRRERHLDRFINDDKCRVFIGQLQAAGVGLDGLQRVAAHVVVVEQSWTPADSAQAIMRLHRDGQRHPTTATICNASETLDDEVNRVLARKLRMIVEIVSD